MVLYKSYKKPDYDLTMISLGSYMAQTMVSLESLQTYLLWQTMISLGLYERETRDCMFQCFGFVLAMVLMVVDR